MASKARVNGIVFSNTRCNNCLHYSSRGCGHENNKRRHLLAFPLEWYRDGNMCVCPRALTPFLCIALADFTMKAIIIACLASFRQLFVTANQNQQDRQRQIFFTQRPPFLFSSQRPINSPIRLSLQMALPQPQCRSSDGAGQVGQSDSNSSAARGYTCKPRH